MEVSNIIMHPLPQMTNKGERKMKLSKLREKLENNKELRNKQARKIKRLKTKSSVVLFLRNTSNLQEKVWKKLLKAVS